MKEIKLANDRGIALVDNEDYEMLSQYKWRIMRNNYALTTIKFNNKWITKKMHRLIMNEPKGMQIDHIDNNGLNNQKNNLRIVTHSQNMMNKHKRWGVSKHKGVSFFKRDNNWRAYISINKKQIHLGYFNFEIKAAMAYNKSAKELFGEYANLNEV